MCVTHRWQGFEEVLGKSEPTAAWAHEAHKGRSLSPSESVGLVPSKGMTKAWKSAVTSTVHPAFLPVHLQ